MAVLSKLIVNIEANSAKFVTEIEKSRKATESLKSSLSLIKFDALVNLGERAFHVGEQIYQMGKEIAGATNEIQRNAGIMGVSTDLYQKMAYAAKMMDVSVEDISTGMKKLSSGMADNNKTFAELGIKTRESTGEFRSLDAMLMDIADKFKLMPDGAEKIAAAVDLFGRSGQNLIPFLNKGAAGIKEFYKEAERLGVVLSEDIIRKGSEAEDMFKRTDEQFKVLKLSLAPLVLGVATLAANFAQTTMEMKNNAEEGTFLKGVWEGIKKAIKGSGENPWKIEEIEKSSKAMREAFSIPAESAEKFTRAMREAAIYSDAMRGSQLTIDQILESSTGKVERQQKAMRESLNIMASLGIKTEGGAKAEIEAAIEKFRTLSTAGIKGEDLAKAKAALTAQIEEIKAKYSNFFGWQETEFEDTSVKWIQSIPKDKMTAAVEEMARDAIKELDKIEKGMDQLERPRVMEINYTPVQNAEQAVEMLRNRLIDVTSTSWVVNMEIVGHGSSAAPIMDKISEIENAFQSMGSGVGQMVLSMNLSQISGEIQGLRNKLYQTSQGPGTTYGWNAAYVEKQWERSRASWSEQLTGLQQQYQMLSSTQFGQGGNGYGGGGGGGGGVSINIGVINVGGGGSAEIVSNIDAELAKLWEQDRSRLKRAIEG